MLSTSNYVVGGIVLALLLVLAGQTYYVHYQSEKLGETKVQLKELNDGIKEANKSIQTQTVVAAATEAAVVQTTNRITSNTEKGTAIKAVVDNVTKRVANETISNTIANVAYVNSMWDAYCTANQGDSACTGRQSSN